MTGTEPPPAVTGRRAAEPEEVPPHPGRFDALTEAERARIREAARQAAASFPPMSDELARLVRRTLTGAAR